MALNLKLKCLFIEYVKVKPKVSNPNTINFISFNKHEQLRFMNNSPDLSNGIDSSEESDFHVYFKRTVRNFQHK